MGLLQDFYYSSRMRLFVEFRLLGLMWFGLVICACSPKSDSDRVKIEVLAISQLPHPKKMAYPNAYGVVHVRTATGEEALVALPAILERQVLNAYLEIKVGAQLKLHLQPWETRPAKLKTSFIANDMADLYDHKIYYSESL